MVPGRRGKARFKIHVKKSSQRYDCQDSARAVSPHREGLSAMTTLRLHLSVLVLDDLKAEARARGTTPTALASAILRLVINEDLVDAVLADAKVEAGNTTINRKRWTKVRVDKLRKLADEGYTAREMASRLGGISKNAVIGKADRLGLKLAQRRRKST